MPPPRETHDGRGLLQPLLEHWQRERTSREQARAALPASWRDNPHPTMHEVSETYLEAMREWNRSCRLAAVADDDR